MKVLLVNKFYYPRGGDCVVTLNTEALLKQQGHEVAVFAMNYEQNLPSEWQKYFASSTSFSNGSKLKAIERIMGLGDIVSSFSKMLSDFKPDVVHLHNIHSYISPIVAKLSHKHGCRVVWTLHDYKLLCPAYTCTRNGAPCELCFNDKSNVLKHRCMKGSLPASTAAWLEALKWNRKKLEQWVDVFICPSQFMASKMEQGGFSKNKIATLCNFIDPTKLEAFKTISHNDQSNYYCYVGRLSSEKGIVTLLEAASALPYTLKVAGDGPLSAELRSRFNNANIEFLGHQSANQVSELLNGARFSVLPSEWYENNPLGVIESLCAGTPVIGSRMGGIPELISPSSGLTFDMGKTDQLKHCIDTAWNAEWNYAEIKNESIAQFSPETHYNKLIQIYSTTKKVV